MYGKSNIETYITICKKDSQWEFAVWHRKLKQGLCINLEGWVEKAIAPQLQYSCLENPMDGGAWQAAVHGVAKSRTRLTNFTFTFHFHSLEKEMATHSRVLAWRIPGMGELGGCHLWGCTESDMTEATQQQQQQQQQRGGLGREMGGRLKRERIHVYLWLIQVEV